MVKERNPLGLVISTNSTSHMHSIPPSTSLRCDHSPCRLKVFKKLLVFGLVAVSIPYLLYLHQNNEQVEKVPEAVTTRSDNPTAKEDPGSSTVSETKKPTEPPKSTDNILASQLPLRYRLSRKGKILVGREFNVSREFLHSLSLPQKQFMDLNWNTVSDLIFVTAASENHFYESKAAITRVQHYVPRATILYYDLGLAEDQIKILRTWCNVEYRRFNFSYFPPHVQDLRLYSWKPLIVQEIFKEYPQKGLVWMDASFRLQTSNLSVVFEKVVSNRGLFTFNHCSHSVFAATHPQMYEFLRTDTEQLKPLNMQGANSLFIYPTKEIYYGFLYWWYLCALDESCQSPPNITRPCPLVFEKIADRRNVYIAFCHRYDQSSLNVLIGNMYGYDINKYTIRNASEVVRIERKKWLEFEIKLCPVDVDNASN